MSHKTRKVAGVIASIAVGISLLGAGTYASFTDNATATASIATGTYGIVLHSDSANVVGNDSHAISLTGPMITSSGAGSLALPFKVVNTGSIPATVTITADDSGLNGHFSDALGGLPIVVTVPGNSSSAATYAGGINWAPLDGSDLNKTETVKYTAAASN